MKNIFALLLVCTSILSCSTEPERDYVLFSGNVSNLNTDKILVSGPDFEKEIELNGDGTFADTLKINEAGFYSFQIGRESSSMYLKQEDSLNLSIDTKLFDESINYSGIGAAENNYMASKYLTIESSIGASKEFYTLDEVAYKSKVGEIKSKNLEALDALTNADPTFIALEKKNLDYDVLELLNKYERYHSHYAKKPEFQVSEGFLPKELKKLPMDNIEDYKNSNGYRSIVYGKVSNEIFDAIGEDYLTATAEDMTRLTLVKIPQLKDDFINNYGSFLVSPGNPNAESLYHYFIEQSTDEAFKRELTASFESIKDLLPGNPSPTFVNYENFKGGSTSLADLKGKYVYIDIWATWCGPCIREIPALKQLEKKYHGKNIEFVSISIDDARRSGSDEKAHQDWKEFVAKEELSGIQLFSDKAWGSDFVKGYHITGIPRFIIIGPDGNIVSADAPRPSHPRLIKLIDEFKM